jgi:uncharacterized protein YcbK (DUF882 family)
MKKYIAPYILQSEYACHHCKALPPGLDLTSVSFIYSILFTDFRKIREKWGKPLDITSGYRCPTHQRFLWNVGQSPSPLSVHVFGLALDINVNSANDVEGLVHVAEAIDPDLRIGYREYLAKGQTFVHIDIGYLMNPIYDAQLREGARW